MEVTLNAKIVDLKELPVDLRLILSCYCETLGDLLSYSVFDLLKFEGIGLREASQIKDQVKKIKLSLQEINEIKEILKHAKSFLEKLDQVDEVLNNGQLLLKDEKFIDSSYFTCPYIERNPEVIKLMEECDLLIEKRKVIGFIIYKVREYPNKVFEFSHIYNELSIQIEENLKKVWEINNNEQRHR